VSRKSGKRVFGGPGVCALYIKILESMPFTKKCFTKGSISRKEKNRKIAFALET